MNTKEPFERGVGNSLAEWAMHDMYIYAGSTPSPPKPFDMPKESETKDAIILSYDWAVLGENEQQKHSVAIYWEFKQKFYAAELLYIKSDPKAPVFERVFLHTVRSFRPLRDQLNH